MHGPPSTSDLCSFQGIGVQEPEYKESTLGAEVVGGSRAADEIAIPFDIAHTCHVTDLKGSTAKVSCDPCQCIFLYLRHCATAYRAQLTTVTRNRYRATDPLSNGYRHDAGTT